MVSINFAQLSDLEEILQIEKEDPYPWNISSLSYQLEIDDIAIFKVAKIKQEIVGYYIINILFEQSEIIKIATKQKYRRQGIGNMMLIDMIKEAKKRGAQTLHLEVRVSNKAAISLYERHFFIASGIRKGYYNGNEDGIRMVKQL